MKRGGLVITMGRSGISSGIAPSSMSSLQGATLEKRLPSEVQVPGVGLSRQPGPKVPRGPHTSSQPINLRNPGY